MKFGVLYKRCRVSHKNRLSNSHTLLTGVSEFLFVPSVLTVRFWWKSVPKILRKFHW